MASFVNQAHVALEYVTSGQCRRINLMYVDVLALSPGSLCVLHWRAWYFFSCDLTYIIACGLERLLLFSTFCW